MSDDGTSPRMRGKLEFSNSISSKDRNIPAYAGKTDTTRDSRFLRREHPRVCGENIMNPHRLYRLCGTSPRMRGKHDV